MPPSEETIRKTFRIELWRSLPIGMLETLFMTFALLAALDYYDAGWVEKAFLMSISQAGLIGSLAVVPLVRRLGWELTTVAAVLSMFGAVGIGFAAAFSHSLPLYLAGLGFGFFTFMLPIPLLTQIYQTNYPSARRGKLFALNIIARGIVAVIFGKLAGDWLDRDMANIHALLWIFAIAAAVSAVLTYRIPNVQLSSGSTNPFTAFRWLRDDKKFRHLIYAWMLMGLGNLTALKLWVEYFASEDYQHGFSAADVATLTIVVPTTVKLLATYPWGWVFDRINFYTLRIVLNALFAIAVLVVFFGEGFWVIAIGTGLQGFAFAGGNIAWSLWVTKLAPPEHTAEYMSVHTFMTGVRGVIAPFIGFALLPIIGSWLAVICAGMMIFSSVIILPEARLAKARRKGTPIAPRDPSA